MSLCEKCSEIIDKEYQKYGGSRLPWIHCHHDEEIKTTDNTAFNLKEAVENLQKLSEKIKEKRHPELCGVCGGFQVSVKGSVLMSNNKIVCPQCLSDRMDMIEKNKEPVLDRSGEEGIISSREKVKQNLVQAKTLVAGCIQHTSGKLRKDLHAVMYDIQNIEHKEFYS